MKQIALALSVIAVVVAGVAFFKPAQKIVEQQLGASGSTFTNRVDFLGGTLEGGVIATSSQASSITLSGAELQKWLDSSLVSYTPGLNTLTLTLPASSTIPFILPHAGDEEVFCLRNATSTSNVQITVAGGTGTNFLVASSSVSALGSTKINTGKLGCFRAVREPSTTTTFDIDVMFTAFQ